MGFLGALKNAVTGGAATVSLETEHQMLAVGSTYSVKVTVTSTGSEMKSKGVFVDLEGLETVQYRDGDNRRQERVEKSFSQNFQIAPAFTLAPNETKVVEGTFTLPAGAQPTYKGPNAEHTWKIRGRAEALGNDPDSGFRNIHVVAVM